MRRVFLIKLSLQLDNLLLFFLIAYFSHVFRHIQFVLHVSKLVVKSLNLLILAIDLASELVDLSRAFHQLDVSLSKL